MILSQEFFLFAVLNFQTSESESLTESAGFCAIPERTANSRWQLHFRLRKWDKEQQDFVLLSEFLSENSKETFCEILLETY